MKRFTIFTLVAVLALALAPVAAFAYEEASAFSYYGGSQSNTLAGVSGQAQVHGPHGAVQSQAQKAGNVQAQVGAYSNTSYSLIVRVDPIASSSSKGLSLQGQGIAGHQTQAAFGGLGTQQQNLIQTGTQSQSGAAGGSARAWR